MFKFKPEEVEKLIRLASTGPASIRWEAAADLLNRELEAHLATLPILPIVKLVSGGWVSPHSRAVTHTALLWGITEIEKKECAEHEGTLYRGINGQTEGQDYIYPEFPKCKHCGVKLKAKWEKA